MRNWMDDIAVTAAELIVEQGLDYGAAKKKAARQLNAPSRVRLPDNERVEQQVREHLAIYHAQTQAAELAALRQLALHWMQRLAEFRPYVSAGVWNGTAHKLSDIHLQLFCDDSKAAEIYLIDQDMAYKSHAGRGFHGREVNILSFDVFCAQLDAWVGIQLAIYDYDDIRGALRDRVDGQALRGNAQALQARLEDAT